MTRSDGTKSIPELLEENAKKQAHYRRMAFTLAVISIVLASVALYLRWRVS